VDEIDPLAIIENNKPRIAICEECKESFTTRSPRRHGLFCRACRKKIRRQQAAERHTGNPPVRPQGSASHSQKPVETDDYMDKMAPNNPCARCVFLRECRTLVSEYSEIDPYCWVSSKFHHRYLAEYGHRLGEPRQIDMFEAVTA